MPCPFFLPIKKNYDFPHPRFPRNSLSLHLFSEQCRSPRVEAEGTRTYFIGKALLALCAWHMGIWQFHTNSQEHKATMTLMGMLYPDRLCTQPLPGYDAIQTAYTYRRGLRRCSFKLLGRCQSLHVQDEQQGDSHASSYI